MTATLAPTGPRLVDPATGRPLRADRPWSLTDGGTRWPVVEGIPFLRQGREALRRSALEALDAGDGRAALALLLADQDDYARTPPPDTPALDRLIEAVDSGAATLRDAMAALRYGPVADYFAHRWSTPTYLSGLALLDRHLPAGATVIEVACGIGHYLRALAGRGVACSGVDVVFSKLWLARRFVAPPAMPLACGDAVAGLPVAAGSGSTVVFCHDAFYFLRDKPRVVAAFRRVAGEAGLILIGHAHNAAFDHRGVAGEPKTPDEYAGLLPGCRMYDDADLARSAWSGAPASAWTPEGLARVGPEDPGSFTSRPPTLTLPHEGGGDQTARPASGDRATSDGLPPPSWGRAGVGGENMAPPEGSGTPRAGVEAVAMAWSATGQVDRGGANRLVLPPAGARLRLNPMLADEGGTLRPRWPSARFEAEYAAESPYLDGEKVPSAEALRLATLGRVDAPEVARLARLRILLELPDRW